jgi:hypothetical protein
MAGRPRKEDSFKKLLNFIVSEETLNKIKEKAKQEETTMSVLIRKAVRLYLAENKDE